MSSTVLVCNGGITSSFVRKVEPSVDMPFDSDVSSTEIIEAYVTIGACDSMDNTLRQRSQGENCWCVKEAMIL
ncbi:hypothetical protein GIB67_006853 [Kingdonia uniflora]|uniref:Uncharacterized protein n=1 Tax=Kingdonia uniflora TaxID=39325 RepID=A0A7J7L014_9MAGN|nr:hypothetical protein GIB67_006853 [Kingdonia uniflora]